MSEAGRHVERKIGDAVPDFQILGVQDIGRIEVGGEFRAELREGRDRVVPSAFDLDRRNVPMPPIFVLAIRKSISMRFAAQDMCSWAWPE